MGTHECCQVVELEPHSKLRVFALTLGSVRVELCSLGASITKFLIGDDDIVLGYKDGLEMLQSGNPVYFSAVVGRVANRIAKGKFELGGHSYELETNNGPNHLHGGNCGFSHKIWDADVISNDRSDIGENCVRFSLISDDGDQGYPGSIEVVATYSLQQDESTPLTKIVLRLVMEARSLDGKVTPINLAHHSYFNLSRHDDPMGILQHRLVIESDSYTPVDDTSIPTREVRSLDEDPTMDWRSERNLRDGLVDYGVEKIGLSKEQALRNLELRKPLANPYGFDHNYIVRRNEAADDCSLSKVGSIVHGSRELSVYSNAPGVQLYTANFLNGREGGDTSSACKATYGPWQGICLETQHFPDSISDKAEGANDAYLTGKCFLLRPDGREYYHCVEYHLAEKEDQPFISMKTGGYDTNGNHYGCIEEMWEAQDLESWYSRAKDYYEDNCETTIDGVLGGLGFLSTIDISASKEFLNDLEIPQKNGSPSVACECGAGIGRVTKSLLLDVCERCDLIESSARLLGAAPEHIGDAGAARCRFFCSGLQEWEPAAGKYSIIWIQWVLCYLTDDDIVSFLKRCGAGLVDDGFIIMKENVTADENFVVDVDDASVTRSLSYWLSLIDRAKLNVKKQVWQPDMPDDIFPVIMIALQAS